jgi:site-specific DNA-methyltransferase (adenine-specific)
MEYMKTLSDNAFGIAIVDPPYGIRVGINGRVGDDKCAPCKQYKPVRWDEKPPNETYFKELKRVSSNQIIWGINYHPFCLTGGRIVWDKDNSGDFSDYELA